MSKEQDSETIETLSTASDAQPQQQQPQQDQIQLQIDDADTPVLYSSTARVWGSAEEINLDFAGPVRATQQPKVARLKIDQRVVLNPWAAKRLALALGQAVGRYEQAYGTLELDERKRRVRGAAPAVGAGSTPA